MQYQFTQGARRALAAAAGWRACDDCDEFGAPALLLGLLAESECRAAIMLTRHAIDAAAVRREWPELSRVEPPDGSVDAIPRRFSADVELSLQAACERLAEYPRPLELATEHLLLGLVAVDHEASVWLHQQGIAPDAIEAEIHRLYGHRPVPLPMHETDIELDQAERDDGQWVAGGELFQQTPVLRVIDAVANRAREGIRVVEDYVRFMLDDRHLTGRCKQLRHDLAAALERVSVAQRLAARETQADVGTVLTTASEESRQNATAVLGANFTRLQEALRSLEEFGKLVDVDMAAAMKQLRYRSYTVQRAVEVTRTSIEWLDRLRLYVLIDGRSSREALQRLAASLVEAGTHVIQFRDKQLDDGVLLDRARLLRDLTTGSGTLLIVNDRPDLAALARADGVHLGQEDVSVKDARTIVGPEMLIGVSTHSIEQARQAVLDGANYIGVGPTFPSGTKQFNEFPGLELLQAVSAEIRLPAFAIGGITRESLPEVLAAGVSRVAVSGAITGTDDPAAATREMLAELRSGIDA